MIVLNISLFSFRHAWSLQILKVKEDSRSSCSGTFWLFPFPNVLRFVYIYIYIERERERVATQGFSSSLELRVQFCLLVCCTYPSLSTVNKEKNLKISVLLYEWTREKHNRFPTRMVYLYYISCLRYTILVGNPGYIGVLKV